MTLLSGELVAYSETTYMLNLPESFPIDIPPGVTVEPLNSTPVVVWTTAPSPPVALFDIQPTGSSGPATVIRGITFVGGQAALRFEGTVDDVFRVTGDDIKLAWNQVGVKAIATDGQFIDLDMNDCQVRDDTTTVNPGPVLQAPQIGFQFHALETAQGSDPPHIVVDLDNLTTSGTFATMDPSQAFLGETDLGVGGSRLIEVWIPRSFTPEYTFVYPSWQRRPVIASVVLTATGGIWDGGPDSAAAGWDVGLYANAAPSGSTLTDNYTGAYEITLSGVTARRFRLAGIHAGAGTYTRGQFFMKANSVVRGTGFGSGGSSGMNGIHLYEYEGYLAFHGVGSDFLDNLGSGIYANADITLQGGGPFPMGLYLDMRNSDIHGNARHGMELRGAMAGVAGNQGANIGGTWDWDQFSNRWLMVRDLPVTTLDPDLGYGPGSVNRCRISNNGKVGIDVQVHGVGTQNSRFSAADFRVVNSYIWNNPEGGIHGRLYSPFDHDGPYYLVPVLQSTLAGNGDTVGWNLEIEEIQSPNLTNGSYRWTTQASPSGTYVETKVRESILQRKNYQDNDLGNYLAGQSGIGVPDGPSVAVDEVGIDGVRSANLPAGTYQETTSAATPFTISPPNWTATDLVLVGLELLSGGSSIFYRSPMFWETFEEETGFDYSWDPRPSVASGTRDKGPEEVQ